MVKVRFLAPMALGICLIIFWCPILWAGFSMEDSWFFQATTISLKDILDSLFHLEFGYYRPIRSIFFRLLAPGGGIPDPVVLHGGALLLFLWSILCFHRLLRRLGDRLGFLIPLAFGVQVAFHKPLYWIVAVHNLLSLLFLLFSFLSAKGGKRRNRDLFFLLSLLSRELSLLALPALLWFDFFRERPKSWKDYLKRNIGLVFLSGLSAVFFSLINSGDKAFHLLGSGPEILQQLSSYAAVFIWPLKIDFISYQQGPRLWAAIAFLLFMTLVSLSIYGKNKSFFSGRFYFGFLY